ITAILWPCCSLRMRLTSVVFPLPRKPVSMVTGTMFSCAAKFDLLTRSARATLFERAEPKKFASGASLKRRGAAQKRAHYSMLRMTKQPFGQCGLAQLISFEQQALKVLALRELDPHGMVGRGAISLA